MKATTIVVMLSVLVAPAAGAAGNAQAGAAKAKEVCAACHGLDGNSATADFPRIGGQHQDYLAHSLRAYKSGKRKNPVMAPFAATLSPQDIDNVAAHYAAQPRVLHVRPEESPK